MRAEDFFARKADENPAFKAAWDAEAAMSVLALNMYRLRKQLQLTQAELGKRAGLSQPKIAKIERGDANPELRTLGRLAGALGISVGELLTDPYAGEAAVEAPDVRRQTRSFYEVPASSFEGNWRTARSGPVLRRTQAAPAAVTENDNFALVA
jgi:transcriptional regulator with XRE-family HTH domain